MINYMLMNLFFGACFFLGFLLLYESTHSMFFIDIYSFNNIDVLSNQYNLGIILIFMYILLKLGIFPLNLVYIRYMSLYDKMTFFYLLLVPKLVIVLFFKRFLVLCGIFLSQNVVLFFILLIFLLLNIVIANYKMIRHQTIYPFLIFSSTSFMGLVLLFMLIPLDTFLYV